MKIYNQVGCILEDKFMTEAEFEKFKKIGWLKEEEYKKLHSKEFENKT